MARVRRARGVFWVVGATVLALLLPSPSYADHDGEPQGPGGGGGNGGGQGRGDPPTALAMDSHGRTYVGFAGGGDLTRVTRKGKVIKPFEVPIGGPVTGIAIGKYDRVWVDNGRTAVLLRRDGSEVGRLTHGPERCGARAGKAARYGGIDAFGKTVFIANRCERTVEVFRRTGKRLAVLKPKGPGFPRGVAYLPGRGNRHARLYVTMPARGVVLVYDVEKVRTGEKPVRTVKVPRPAGGKRPEPSGVVVDRSAQVIVSDRANHGLYFLDGNHSFKHYRTLGHPPRRGRGWGRLDGPVGLAQHRRDRSGLSGTIVVADGRNRRVQRWNTYGYTYWVSGVAAPKG